MRNSATPGAVGELAELVLPWLPPQDLAAAASASRALRAAASSVSAGRAADAAHGLEPHPIPSTTSSTASPTPTSSTPLLPHPVLRLRLTPPRPAVGRTWARPPGPTWPRSDPRRVPSSGCACAQGRAAARGCPCADPEAGGGRLGVGGGDGEPQGVRRRVRVRALVREPADPARRHGAAARRAPPGERVGAARRRGPSPRAVRLRVCW